MNEIFLIVNADDYGLTRNVSRGIREAHASGIVTSTSAMMNMEGVEGDLHVAALETPELGIGVHLTLTAGKPVLPVSQVSSLVDAHGRFYTLNSMPEVTQYFDLLQVYQEWKAQIEKMLNAGTVPDHLDSHHHISYKYTPFLNIMLRLAREYNLPIRSDSVYKPVDYQQNSPDVLSANLNAKKVPSPDFLITRFYGNAVSLELLEQVFAQLKKGTTELMTHPGISDESLASLSSYTKNRELELSLLSSKEVKSLLAQFAITLSTFGSV